ncbi:hypothetical protein CR970_04435 [Candidatus Saccharibacteria bacterium]|nr:MAG: hypothetical protein CR970_04435 [Candidatus Saccharibacteria bacterium]
MLVGGDNCTAALALAPPPNGVRSLLVAGIDYSGVVTAVGAYHVNILTPRYRKSKWKTAVKTVDSKNQAHIGLVFCLQRLLAAGRTLSYC